MQFIKLVFLILFGIQVISKNKLQIYQFNDQNQIKLFLDKFDVLFKSVQLI